VLLEARGKDFCGYKDVAIPLKKQGLVWVGGDNRDTRAATSNGAGKTTLFKLITWILYERTLDGERNFNPGDKVIRNGAKLARGELDLDGGWTVWRERSKGGMRLGLRKPDGTDWEGSKDEAQAKIIEIIGLDFKAFRNTVLYGQNDIKRFAAPDTADPERKDMLHRILRTEVLGAAHKLAQSKALAARKAAEDAGAHAARAKTKLEEAANQREAAKARASAWDADRRRRIEAMKAEVQSLREEAAAVAEEGPSVDELEGAMAAARERIALAEKAAERAEAARERLAKVEGVITSMGADYNRAIDQADRAERQLAKLNGEACPTCHSPLKKGEAAKHLASLRAEAKDRREVADHLQAFIKEHKKTRDQHRAERDEAQAAANDGRRARAALDELTSQMREAAEAEGRRDALVARARAKLESAKTLAMEDNPHTATIADIDKKMGELTDAWALSESHAGDLRASAAQMDFWVRGFSGQGLPSFVLDSVMPYITERANHYLEILSDGDIAMEFSTQRELKSDKGALRDEIAITWTIEGIDGYPPSGGQQRKMEIATDLALMDLTEAREGAGLSLFMADEILDGLDREGRERVLMLLHELRARRGSIFVVSHNDAMSELFEHEITVVKEGGVARLEVVR
jgi:DNA repair exonuclease SbcCD ATPase subunit